MFYTFCISTWIHIRKLHTTSIFSYISSYGNVYQEWNKNLEALILLSSSWKHIFLSIEKWYNGSCCLYSSVSVLLTMSRNIIITPSSIRMFSVMFSLTFPPFHYSSKKWNRYWVFKVYTTVWYLSFNKMGIFLLCLWTLGCNFKVPLIPFLHIQRITQIYYNFYT